MVEKTSGKPRKDWGPAETAEYNRLFLDALPQVEPRDYVRLNAVTGQWEYGNGMWPVGHAGNVIETHEQKAATR